MKRDILYVDDQPENIVVFQSGFEDDFNIWTASSGKEALEILEKVPIPVVVADQRMPEMTGVELFELMRQRYPHTKRIILTGYTDPAAMLNAINKGQVFYFVTKPWERHYLMSVLIRAIEAHDMSLANTALTDRLVASQRSATLGQVAARVAHEMGNQLCMLPLLELIEDRYGDHEDLVKMAQFAQDTHERLVALIDEVKAFVRCEHGRFPRHPISLADIVHELVSFLRFDNTIPHTRLHVEVREDSVIYANRVKIQQVLVNLIKNAAHAIREEPDGRITLTLDRDGEEAVLKVVDNGCGMPPDVLARIWEPFFTTKGNDGTGLGLDISRQLIESHGGQIFCESAANKGTTFTIRLPLAQAGDQHREAARVEGDKAAVEKSGDRSQRPSFRDDETASAEELLSSNR